MHTTKQLHHHQPNQPNHITCHSMLHDDMICCCCASPEIVICYYTVVVFIVVAIVVNVLAFIL